MRIEVPDKESELSRDLYVFDYNFYQGFRLDSYHQQTRQTKRHKWTGPFWASADERSYHSKLTRPETVPPHVILAVIQVVTEKIEKMPFYVGWFNPEHRLKE